MKTYVHKSGKYVIEESTVRTRRSIFTRYRLKDLNSPSSIEVTKEFFENSNDWSEVIIDSQYSHRNIEIAFRTFVGGMLVNGQSLSYSKKLFLEEIFFAHLLDQKK